MKKNLKSKILLCVLAGGVLAANTVMAEEYTETIIDDITLNNGDTITVNDVDDSGIDSVNKNLVINVNGEASINACQTSLSNVDGIIGINLKNGGILVNSADENAKLKITTAGGAKAYGIYINNENYEVEINPRLEINVEDAEADGLASSFIKKSYGIYAKVSDADKARIFNGDVLINITSNYGSEFAAIRSEVDSLKFNGEVCALINSNNDIGASDNGVTSGITTLAGANIDFNKKVDLNVTTNNKNKNVSIAGVFSGVSAVSDGASIINFYDDANIKVNNKNGSTSGVLSVGLLGSEAYVNFRDNVNIEVIGEDVLSSNAIEAGSKGIVDISKQEMAVDKNNAVHGVIKGAIISGGYGDDDESKVNVNLIGKDSLIDGDIIILSDNSKVTLGLYEGAVWRARAGDISEVTSLNIDGGIIEQNTNQDITIQQYSGTGNINFTAEDTDVDGVADFNSIGDVTIKNAEKDSFVELGITNDSINTLDIAKTEENLNAVANKLYYDANDGNLNGKVVIKEGFITPEASGDLLFDTNDRGYVTNITGGNRTTETMYAMKNLAATAIVAWRQEDSTLSQRLGELRDNADGQGIWVRMSRGEFEYDGEYKNQYNFFQMGYDWAADDWHYGAAISHNDGQTTYTYGDGENRSTSLSLYGTWLGDKGHYADIVLKQGRLSNDFDIYTSAGHTSGDYDAWGTSLSGEYGKKIALEDGWYVTPQAQLTLMRIGGEDYTTNNGINVHQDTLHSAVGRLGFELGKKIDDKGSVYAKASMLHDFAGNAETYLSYKGFANSYSQDISDTWCEAGIGFNYKTSDNSYVYADVVKTFGGDVETPWQWNAGMRWSF